MARSKIKIGQALRGDIPRDDDEPPQLQRSCYFSLGGEQYIEGDNEQDLAIRDQIIELIYQFSKPTLSPKIANSERQAGNRRWFQNRATHAEILEVIRLNPGRTVQELAPMIYKPHLGSAWEKPWKPEEFDHAVAKLRQAFTVIRPPFRKNIDNQKIFYPPGHQDLSEPMIKTFDEQTIKDALKEIEMERQEAQRRQEEIKMRRLSLKPPEHTTLPPEPEPLSWPKKSDKNLSWPRKSAKSQ